MDYGFLRVAAAVPRLSVADCSYNADNIIESAAHAERSGARILVFPELSLTAYTCGDLFLQKTLLASAEKELGRICSSTRSNHALIVLGMPVQADNLLFNCAIVIHRGEILGAVPKSSIPGYKEFYEKRWFASGRGVLNKDITLCGESVPFGVDLLFQAESDPSVCIGIEICEDLWTPIPPSARQAAAGATVLLNLSASNEVIGKYEYRKSLVSQESARCVAAYVYSSCGIDESSTDLVFSGHALICDYGTVLAESERFSLTSELIVSDVDIERLVTERFSLTSFTEGQPSGGFRKITVPLDTKLDGPLARRYTPHPFVPEDASLRDSRCAEIFAIQTAGLGKRLRHTGLKKAVIGVSGGLDSTLALLVIAGTFDRLSLPRENIIAVTMPGFGTTDATCANALELMKSMNVTVREIPIRDAALLHFRDIGHDPLVHDLTYENVQARERTQILMDLANMHDGIVIGTGDLSELALGFATYNGDHMSMYAVNSSIPKTLVRYLVQWVADNLVSEGSHNVLHRILETPISPELLPPSADGTIRQKTEEVIGPYELHDFFLYHFVRYGATPRKLLYLARHAFGTTYPPAVIRKWLILFLKRFFSQQFKRSCMPDGPKVGTISLSPRGDWRMPSDASVRIWLDDLERPDVPDV